MTHADMVDALARLSPAQRELTLRRLPAQVRVQMQERWVKWAHDGQLEPAGIWRIWLIRAGRGFGKTRAGAEWVSDFARRTPGSRIALVGATADDVRRVMIEGESGLLAVARDNEEVRWTAARGEVAFPSGALAQVFSAAAPERLRGPQHHIAWCDELGAWREGENAWHNLMMGLRLGERPRTIVTTTPRTSKLMRRLMQIEGLIETRGRTRDNPALPVDFISAVEGNYAGTRLGRQELDGELIDEVEGALWTRDLLEACRVRRRSPLVRVVVGVDPPAGSVRNGRTGGPGNPGGDACGIVAVGLDRDGRAYVIEDASVASGSPETWARAVARCAARVRADRVVAEANQGGRMVESVLRAADVALPVKLVRASKGKVARAEPVVALYEADKVRHVGAFEALEDEMCGLVLGGGYEGPGRSPDRADALVWALTELMLTKRRVARVRKIG